MHIIIIVEKCNNMYNVIHITSSFNNTILQPLSIIITVNFLDQQQLQTLISKIITVKLSNNMYNIVYIIDD